MTPAFGAVASGRARARAGAGRRAAGGPGRRQPQLGQVHALQRAHRRRRQGRQLSRRDRHAHDRRGRARRHRPGRAGRPARHLQPQRALAGRTGRRRRGARARRRPARRRADRRRRHGARAARSTWPARSSTPAPAPSSRSTWSTRRGRSAWPSTRRAWPPTWACRSCPSSRARGTGSTSLRQTLADALRTPRTLPTPVTLPPLAERDVASLAAVVRRELPALGEATRAWTTWALLSIDDAPPDELVGVPAAVRAAGARASTGRRCATGATSISRSSARATSAWTAWWVRPCGRPICRRRVDRPHRRRAHASGRGHRRVRARDAGAVPGALQLVGARHRAHRAPGRAGAGRA